jgi:Sec-independent protein translocase protein TatA
MSYLLLGILLFVLYNFITGFVVPVVRTTSQVKRQFNAMRQQMEEAQQQYQQQAQGPETRQQTKSRGTKGKYDMEGEYIPFEEV